MFSLLNLQSLLGILVVIVAPAGPCRRTGGRFRGSWRWGPSAVQAALVLALFAIPGSQVVLAAITGAVDGLNVATQKGTQFVFGYLAGGDQPYVVGNEGALFTFAFNVLPLILVISALSALLWHWKVLKWITLGFGLLFQKTMGLGGASALAVAANIFLGMIESPIVIRAYLDKLTRSETVPDDGRGSGDRRGIDHGGLCLDPVGGPAQCGGPCAGRLDRLGPGGHPAGAHHHSGEAGAGRARSPTMARP